MDQDDFLERLEGIEGWGSCLSFQEYIPFPDEVFVSSLQNMAGILFGRCMGSTGLVASRYCSFNVGRQQLMQQRSMFSKISIQRSIKRNFSNKSLKEETRWWERFTAERTMPKRYTAAWYGEMLLVCTVFGITGSTTMIVRNIHFDDPNTHCTHNTSIGGTPRRERRPWHSRVVDRWTLELSHFLTRHYDAIVRDTLGGGGDHLWSTRLLSAFYGQDLFEVWYPSGIDGCQLS